MEIRCGSLLFTSKFDSGNLARVERVSRDEEIDAKLISSGQELRPDYEYQVWTKPDCHATEFENGNRSWFYFGIRGYVPNKLIKITIMNMNRQSRLYNQGHSPFYRISHPSRPAPTNWARIRDRPTCETVDGQFYLTFVHRFMEPRGGTTYFAFCFPWSYSESQEFLAKLDQDFQYCQKVNPEECGSEEIYYHRELLCYSLDKLRVDLITISDYFGMEERREERFDQKLFPDSSNPRPWKFKRKKVYLVTSRVHPGETPASYVFNGFLKFILRKDDPRAQQLRRQFVIKMIPMLNPDGVAKGHYRTDTRGVNLNRVYLDPDFTLHPTIYATKALLVHHHVTNRMRRDQMYLRAQASHKPLPAHLARQQVQQAKMAAEEAERVRQLKEMLATPIEAPSAEVLHAKNRTYHVVHDDSQDSVLNSIEQAPTTHNVSPDLHPPPDGTINPSLFQGCDGDREVTVESEMLVREKHMMLDQSLMSQELLWTPVSVPHTPAKPAIVSMKFSSPDRNPHHFKPPYRAVSGKPRRIWCWSSQHKNNSSNNKEAIKSSSTPILGNEGSDGESDDEVAAFNPAAPISPHLCDPSLLEIPPEESGISFYIDLHGHCSKRGCFMYGNNLETEEQMIENLVFPKLIALNTAHFDFSGCNFSVKNMYQRDKRDGLSKEGAGRVAIWKHLGLIHSYTLECNYNTGRMVNHVPSVTSGEDGGRATPPPMAGFPPKYTISHYEEVGRAMAIAALDMYCTNPWSRVNSSEQGGLNGVREWVRKYLRGLRGGPRCFGPSNQRSSRYSIVSGSSTSSSQSQAFGSTVNRQSSYPGTSSIRALGQQGAVNTAIRLSRPAPGATGIPTSNYRRSSVGNAKPVITQSSAAAAAPNHSIPPQPNHSNANRQSGSNLGTKPAIIKQEKPSAISRQSISHNRTNQVSRPEPTHETSIPPSAIAVPTPTCSNPPSARAAFLGQPSSSQLPGSVEVLPSSVGFGGSVSDVAASDEAAYRQKAARVLLQMEMISCGASVQGLRQRPFSRTRPSAGATRSIPLLSSTAAASSSNTVTTTIGDSRLILLPYDSTMTATSYSNSSPVLPQMSGVVEPVMLHSRPSAAISEPAIQHSVLDQKMLEDRKVEKLRSLKDPKRRRHDGTSPPHRLGTLKLGNGAIGGGSTGDAIGRRKSRRSMSFAGKTGVNESSLSNRSGGALPGNLSGAVGVTGLSDHSTSVKLSNTKSRSTRHNRRRKTGLHGKQPVFSEGDVGKDGNDGEDSSSPSDLCQPNEESELESKEILQSDVGIILMNETEANAISSVVDEGNELPFNEQLQPLSDVRPEREFANPRIE